MDKMAFVEAVRPAKSHLWVLTPETDAEFDQRVETTFAGRDSAQKSTSENIFEARLVPMTDNEFVASSLRDLSKAALEISADAYFAAIPKSAALQVLNGLSTRISGYMGSASVTLAGCATFTLSEYCRRYNAAHPDDRIAAHIDD
jgi:hypothetical protein